MVLRVPRLHEPCLPSKVAPPPSNPLWLFLIDGEAMIARDDGMPDFHGVRSKRRGHEAVLFVSSVRLMGADGGTICPSSDNLRLVRRFEKGGSGSSGLEIQAASDFLSLGKSSPVPCASATTPSLGIGTIKPGVRPLRRARPPPGSPDGPWNFTNRP